MRPQSLLAGAARTNERYAAENGLQSNQQVNQRASGERPEAEGYGDEGLGNDDAADDGVEAAGAGEGEYDQEDDDYVDQEYGDEVEEEAQAAVGDPQELAQDAMHRL